MLVRGAFARPARKAQVRGAGGGTQVLATTDETPGIVYADLDYKEIKTRRLNMPVAEQRRRDLYVLHDKAPG